MKAGDTCHPIYFSQTCRFSKSSPILMSSDWTSERCNYHHRRRTAPSVTFLATCLDNAKTQLRVSWGTSLTPNRPLAPSTLNKRSFHSSTLVHSLPFLFASLRIVPGPSCLLSVMLINGRHSRIRLLVQQLLLMLLLLSIVPLKNKHGKGDGIITAG